VPIALILSIVPPVVTRASSRAWQDGARPDQVAQPRAGGARPRPPWGRQPAPNCTEAREVRGRRRRGVVGAREPRRPVCLRGPTLSERNVARNQIPGPTPHHEPSAQNGAEPGLPSPAPFDRSAGVGPVRHPRRAPTPRSAGPGGRPPWRSTQGGRPASPGRDVERRVGATQVTGTSRHPTYRGGSSNAWSERSVAVARPGVW
jgi:hypothetical protein